MESTLENHFKKLEAEILSSVICDQLIRKLGKKGIRVTNRHRSNLKKWCDSGALGTLSFADTSKGPNSNVSLSLTKRDERRMRGILGRQLMKSAETTTISLVHRFSRKSLVNMKQMWRASRQREYRELDGFQKRLEHAWRKPLDLLELQLYWAKSTGGEINDSLRPSHKSNTNALFDACTRLHARICQMGSEVFILLKHGYAEGAMTRWRSMHEASIVLQFIIKYGRSTAERYLAHSAVESKKAADEYMRHHERLGYSPLSQPEIDQVKVAYDRTLKRYTSNFKNSYGWAAHALKKDNPTFVDIEGAVGLQHFRPFYRLASHSVHANPKGVTDRLCLFGQEIALPVGPTNYGLADPGDNTGITIAHATSALATLAPTLYRLTLANGISLLSKEIGYAFAEAQKKIEERSLRFNNAR